jgi:hypothetical protein
MANEDRMRGDKNDPLQRRDVLSVIKKTTSIPSGARHTFPHARFISFARVHLSTKFRLFEL